MRFLELLGALFTFLQATGSLPFAYQKDSVNSLTFLPSAVFKFLISIVLALSSWCFLVMINLDDIGWKNLSLKKYRDISGVTMLDMLTFAFGNIIAMIAAILTLVSFIRKSKQVSRFFATIDNITLKYGILAKDVANEVVATCRKGFSLVIILCLINMVLAPVQNWAMYKLVMDEPGVARSQTQVLRIRCWCQSVLLHDDLMP